MKTRKGHKVYPLTSARELHFYCLKYCPKKQVLNIGSSLAIQVDLDWDMLKSCIREAIARCDTMCLCSTHDKEGSVHQCVMREETKKIEHFDFTGWKEEGAEQKFREWTEVPLERYDSPMYHIVMIKTPDGHQGLHIRVDHMTMDVQSLILFFRDMIELYASRLYDGVEYPKEMSSCVRQLEKDLAYEAGNRVCEKDRQFFQEPTVSSEPVFTDIYGPKRLLEERKATRSPKLRIATSTSDNVETNIINSHLEGESSRRLLDFYEKYDISMTCLLLMGLRTYLQKENDQDDVSVTTTTSRRTTLSEKRCGRSRIHCFLFRTIVSREDTFMEGLLKIRDAQNQYLRHAGYSPPECFNYRHDYYKLKDRQTYELLSLTYRPLATKYNGPGLDEPGNIKYKTVYYSNGVAAYTLYLAMNHRAEDNGLDFGFEYQIGVVTPEKPEYIYYYLCRIIFRGVEDPERLVGEIIGMVQNSRAADATDTKMGYNKKGISRKRIKKES